MMVVWMEILVVEGVDDIVVIIIIIINITHPTNITRDDSVSAVICPDSSIVSVLFFLIRDIICFFSL